MYKILLNILIILTIIDSIYLYLTKSLFEKMVLQIQNSDMQIRLNSAIIVYILLTIGLYYFIIKEKKSPYEAALLGLIIYGVFDFTNYAIFKNYDIYIGLLDTIWGSILCGLTTYIYYLFSPEKIL
jgi:uncharacterized membrane protein